MLFGWSFPKLMVLIAVAFLLFGVPLLALAVVFYERWKEETRDE
jgi:hypothetical protein